MTYRDHDEVRYYDADGIEHRLDSEDLHLIDGNGRQNPIIKGILAVAVTLIAVAVAAMTGCILGVIIVWLRRTF